jgi:hypothetical protein
MALAESNALLIEHGLAAVCVLDRAIRLLQAQRPVLLEKLAEVVPSAPRAAGVAVEGGGAHARRIRLADRA